MFSILGVSILSAVSAFAQSYPRRAQIVGGGNPDRGKCTIEVVIDGAAEVEIRGDNANLRNLSGQPPQWRRFECTGPMPANAANFRFAGVDGRGRQELVRDPRNGGAAVIRLEDPQAGAEGYTFDVFWGGSGNFPAGDPRFNNGDRNPPVDNRYPPQGDRNPPGGDRYPPQADRNPPGGDRYPPNVDRGGDHGRWQPGYNRRMPADEAIRVCQESVQQQAEERLHTRQLAFQRVTIDDNPGRNDWVIGTFEVRRYNRDERYRFSCSVDFDSGRVRSAQFEPVDGGGAGGGARPDDRRAFQACQRSVEDRLRRDGFRNANFDSMRYDNRRGRNDWIVGSARVDGRYGGQWFDFVCSTNDNGSVRVVDVTRR
ncbi:MAG TPA: hypothetical protein VIX89_05450 [Bryobacteraceae bacterium]